VGSLTEAAALAEVLLARLADEGGPVLAGFDGRSGVGKSTLAATVAALLAERPAPVRSLVIEGDGFSTGGTAARWDRRTAAEKADQVIDWRRQHAVLDGLRRWGMADWHPFDWEADDWDQDPPPHTDVAISVEVAPIVILEGAYSCRPELHELLDLRVLIDVPSELRRARLLEREGEEYRADWEGRWAEAEDHYFATVMTSDRFDLVVSPV
jgi:uridine kinase